MIKEKNKKEVNDKQKYQLQICNARIKMREGLIIDAYDILGKIIEDMNDIEEDKK